MSEMDKVFEKIDGYRDEFIRFQADLTSRVALGPDNGGTGEHDKSDYLKDRLKELRPDFLEEFRAPDQRARDGFRPNLVARWDTASGGPTVWVLSHMDVVPPGDRNLWGGDPYVVRVEGDRIIGRGVEDNQHGIVSSYLALRAFLETGIELGRPVGLVFVADEETGSEYGLGYLLKHHGDLFLPEDLIVVPDAGNEEGTSIEVAEKSMLWLRFTVTGKQCHASTPEKGRNSLFGAARLIVALEALKGRFSQEDELFHPPRSTFEPTKMEANVPNINTIPGRDVFHVDCRVLPRYGVEEVLDAALEIAGRAGEELGFTVEVETVYRQDAAEPTPAEAPVVRALMGAVRRVSGLEARPIGIGGGTVAAFFRRAGLPAAVWASAPDSAHQPDEYCLIPDLIKDAKVFACLYGGE